MKNNIQRFNSKTENLKMTIIEKSDSYDIDIYNNNLKIIDEKYKKRQLITFWIANTTSSSGTYTRLEGEKGMTWREWVSSDYNTIGLYLTSTSDTGELRSPVTDYTVASPLKMNARSHVIAMHYLIDGEKYTLNTQ